MKIIVFCKKHCRGQVCSTQRGKKKAKHFGRFCKTRIRLRNNRDQSKSFARFVYRQHHGFLFFRDYPVLETILTNDLLTLDKIKPTELLKYCLFGMNIPFKETKDKRNFYYSDVVEAIGRIQQHRPDIF